MPIEKTIMSTSRVHYVIGDATAPVGDGPKVIGHVCNDIGKWGRGFVVALSRRWPQTRQRFLAWHAGQEPQAGEFRLGAVQFVEVEPGLWVANMIGQHLVKPAEGVPPVRYEAIREAMRGVAKFAIEHGASIHMPRIGCGLAGGTWEQVGPIVEDATRDVAAGVYVYDLPAKE